MKKLVISCLLLMLVCTFAGCGYSYNIFGYQSETYSYASEYSIGDFSYNINDVDEIAVYWIRGNVTTMKGAEELNVRETIDQAFEVKDEIKMHWLLKDRKLIVHYCQSGYYFEGALSNFQKDLYIGIPDGIKLTVHTVSACIAVGEYRLKEADILSVSGRISIDDLVCEQELLTIESISGSILFDSISGNTIKFKTVSGEISGNYISGKDVSVKTTSGSFEVKNELKCKSLYVSTVSGKVKANGLDNEKGEIHTTSGEVFAELVNCEDLYVETVSGNVKVVTNQSGFTFSFESVSGDIICSKYSVAGGKYIVGEGLSSLVVKTVSGNLVIE